MQEIDIHAFVDTEHPTFELLLQAAVEVDETKRKKGTVDQFHQNPYKIEFTVNGVELDFQVVAKRLYDAFARSIEQQAGARANAILKEKMVPLDLEVEKLSSAIREAREKLFPEYREERW